MIIKNIITVLRRFGLPCVLAVAGLAIAYSVFYMTVDPSFTTINSKSSIVCARILSMLSLIKHSQLYTGKTIEMAKFTNIYY